MKKDIDKKMLAKLTKLAAQARDNAYAPYSGFPVGVAVLSAGGKTYTGCNCETANYDGTCAEAGAIAAMATAGERLIRAVVVVGPKAGECLCTPCGRCRQRIREFADANTRVYAMRNDGSIGLVGAMDDLLPHSFGPENLIEVGTGVNATIKKKKKQENDERSNRR